MATVFLDRMGYFIVWNSLFLGVFSRRNSDKNPTGFENVTKAGLESMMDTEQYHPTAFKHTTTAGMISSINTINTTYSDLYSPELSNSRK